MQCTVGAGGGLCHVVALLWRRLGDAGVVDVELHAVLTAIESRLSQLTLLQEVANGRVAKLELWKGEHVDRHTVEAVEAAKRSGLEDGRREVQASVSARDKWFFALLVSVVTAVVGVLVRLL